MSLPLDVCEPSLRGRLGLADGRATEGVNGPSSLSEGLAFGEIRCGVGGGLRRTGGTGGFLGETGGLMVGGEVTTVGGEGLAMVGGGDIVASAIAAMLPLGVCVPCPGNACGDWPALQYADQ